MDDNGTLDVAVIESPLQDALLLDLNENSGDTIEKDLNLEVIRGGQFDAEVSVVGTAGKDWVFYDGDDDGTFEIAMHFDAYERLPVATRAFRLEGGKWNPAPGYLGRYAMYAGFLGKDTSKAAKLGAFNEEYVKSVVPRATVNGYPAPGTMPVYRYEKAEKNGLTEFYGSSNTYTIRWFDASSKAPAEPGETRALEDTVKLEWWHLALVSYCDLNWVYFNTDNDFQPEYLVVANASGEVRWAVQFEDGLTETKFTRDPGKGVLQLQVFKDAKVRKRLSQLARG